MVSIRNKLVIAGVVFILLAFAPFSSDFAQAYQETSTVVIEGTDDTKLSILLPDRCSNPYAIKSYFSMRGAWEFSEKSAELKCGTQPLVDLLSIAPAAKKAKSEYLITGEYRLVEKTNKFNRYRFGWKGRESYEVVTFVADDGNKVYVRYLISDPSNQLVFRLLDEKFELTYGVHRQSGAYVEMFENDRKILEFAKLITQRLK